jgi:hypothetical protein
VGIKRVGEAEVSAKRSMAIIVVLMSAFTTSCAAAQNTAAPAQSSAPASPELTVRDIDKIGLPTPENVKVRVENGRAVVSWEKSPIQRIVAYQVFRKNHQGRFVPIKIVTVPPFIDKSIVRKTAEYAVSAVDYRGNRSDMSAPGKVAPAPK